MPLINGAHAGINLEVADTLDRDNHIYIQVRTPGELANEPIAFLDSHGRAELRKHLEQFLSVNPTPNASDELARLRSEVIDLRHQLRNSVSKAHIGQALADAAEAADDSDADAALEQVANELGVDFSAEVEFESTVTLQVTVRGTRPRRLPEEHEIRDLSFDVTVGNFHSETIESIEVMETGDPDVDSIDTV